MVSQSVNLKMFMHNMRETDGKKYTFGVGRSQMYPIHIDHVIRQSERMESHAGPIYNLPKTFGKQGKKMGLHKKDLYEEY